MLVQHCTLDQHRLIVPISVTKPEFDGGQFSGFREPNRYRALVDTGAQRTVVCDAVIARCRLMRTGHMQFKGIHEPRTHTRYLASIGLWASRVGADDPVRDLDSGEQTFFAIEDPIEIVNMDDNANFDVILGFDVLKDFSFSYDGRTRNFQLLVAP